MATDSVDTTVEAELPVPGWVAKVEAAFPTEVAQMGDMMGAAKKDWAPLRVLAQQRARVTLHKVWEDASTGRRIWRASYRRFCYKDYSLVRRGFSVLEGPQTISFVLSVSNDRGPGYKQSWRYILSFKHGRVALYARPAPKKVVRAMPLYLDIMKPIEGGQTTYQRAYAAFTRRLVKLCRSKARANGVKLAKGDYLCFQTFLFDSLYPGLPFLRAAHEAANGKELTDIKKGHGWLLRHLRASSRDGLVKAVTGRSAAEIGDALWASIASPRPLGKWSWLACLRSWLPADQMKRLLAAKPIVEWDPTRFTSNPAKLRRFLKQFRPSEVVTLLTEICPNGKTLLPLMDTLGFCDKSVTPDQRTTALIGAIRAIHKLPSLTLAGKPRDDLELVAKSA